MKIDLHSHTTCSDGLKSPTELVRLVKSCGVDILAVTDHDSTEGVAEAAAEGARVGLKIIPGIEMSSQFEGAEVHVLGIGVDPSHAPLQAQLESMRIQRKERVRKICAALATQGLTLTPDSVLAEAKGKTVGRKHIARAMVKQGLVADLQQAFDRYLADGGPAHVPSSGLSPGEAARFIRQAGGLPVLAHPHFFEDDEQVGRILDTSGIRAIEAYHRYEKPGREIAFLAMARERNLLVTGGSDYHGDDNAKNAMPGDFTTPPDQWAEIARQISPGYNRPA